MPIPPTRLVGRDHEVAQLCDLLDSAGVRLVTLTGPGGVGKTRLAMATAEHMAHGFADGVHFVDLTPVAKPHLVDASIAEALAVSGVAGRPIIDGLCLALQDSTALLLLDNFEHVLDAGPVVSKLLESGANLRILVTSRERLQLRGEHVFPVTPLALPEYGLTANATIEAIAEYSAVRLFLDRAREARQDVDLDDQDAPIVAEICQRLDGLPLAIELAASRMRHEPASTLLDRLEHRLPVLTGGARDLPERQRTLRNAIVWSYDLLTPEQASLFRLLCVFPGGFTLAAAVAMAGDQSSEGAEQPLPNDLTRGQTSPYDMVISLLDQSLIQSVEHTGPSSRFSILEAVREFGLEALAARGEDATARERIVSWYVNQTDPANLEALDGYVGQGPFALSEEQDNLRLALEIALEQGDPTSAVRFAQSLSPFWWEHGLYSEARQSLDKILNLSPALDPAHLAMVLGWAAEWAWLQSDFLQTGELAAAALELCRSIGHEAGTAANLYRLGRVASAIDPPAADIPLQEALAINRRLGNDRDAAWTLLGMGYAAIVMDDLSRAGSCFAEAGKLAETLQDRVRGGLQVSCEQAEAWVALLMGDLEFAEQLLERTLAESRDQLYEYGECNALRLLGRLARGQGDWERSISLHLQALRLSQRLGALRRECYCLIELAAIAQALGQPARAARLLGAEAALRERLHLVYTADERETQYRASDSAQRDLGDQSFGRAWDQGRAMTWDARLAEAQQIH